MLGLARHRDREAIRTQLGRLHARILGELDADTDDSLSLWEAGLAENDDPTEAWKLVITGMLQDPSIVFY